MGDRTKTVARLLSLAVKPDDVMVPRVGLLILTSRNSRQPSKTTCANCAWRRGGPTSDRKAQHFISQGLAALEPHRGKHRRLSPCRPPKAPVMMPSLLQSASHEGASRCGFVTSACLTLRLY